MSQNCPICACNNNEKFVLRLKVQGKLRRPGYCTSAGRMTSVLWHAAEAFSPARQGTILNNHRVIGIATNTSMVLICALVTYLKMTTEIGLPDAVYRHTPKC